MQITIKSASPDGLIVEFDGFYADTYEEAFDLIMKINSIKNEMMENSRITTEKAHDVFTAIKKGV
jgi:hypothetical protein